jgi:acetylornithine deacetylase/succinyl-diaminopimelate desuccinylase-like protein
VQQNHNGVVDFAARLIAAPSPNPGGTELAAAQVAEQRMHLLGMRDTRIVGRSHERANLIYEFDTGKPGPTLLLNGHLDTKPPDPVDAWETNPYEGVLTNGKLYGLGAADMKGPDAALVYGTAAALEAGGNALRGKLLLILSADEEGATTHGPRYLVEDLGIHADAALIAEPAGVTQNWETLPLISRGISIFRCIAAGTQTHSSISDRVPIVHANLVASRLLVYLVENLKLNFPATPLCPLGPTINLGTVLHGVQGLAKIPGRA